MGEIAETVWTIVVGALGTLVVAIWADILWARVQRGRGDGRFADGDD